MLALLLLLLPLPLTLALVSPPNFAPDIKSFYKLEAEAKNSAGTVGKRDSVPAEYVAAPYYPTPPGGWITSWADSFAKAQVVVANMTLAEKVNLTSGSGELMGPCVGNTGSALRFGIPNLCLQDGALGLAATDNITAFPAGVTTGATWNKDLFYQRGYALGQEARGKGVNILLGPMVGPLGRKPRGGRGWEGFGTDPVLQAVAGSETIKGIQANGVIATIKHLVGNEQEKYRMDIIPHGLMKAISSNIDDRTLHELYLWPFAEGIKTGVGAVMTSYNDVNGSAASQNSMLINGILKDELGFQGITMTDWLAQISGVGSALAGLDMAMPGDGDIPFLGLSYWASDLSTAVLNGTVPVSRLNDMVTRIVATWYQLGQDQDYPLPNFSANTAAATGPCYPAALISPTCVTNQYVNVQGDHAVVARNVSREAITMLKNENSTLPLSTAATVFVFGTDAENNPSGPNSCSQRDCDTGVLGMGWGSGTANYPYLDAPIDAINRKLVTNATYYNSDTFPSITTVGADDIAIVFINSDSGENQHTVEGNNGDRDASGLYAWHNGDALVEAAAAVFSNVVVVVHTVGPILVENWIDLPSVQAVVFAYLPGQEAGDSLTDILFGDYSPSGHLPWSIPVAESDYPASVSLQGFALGQVQDTFSEGLYIDYRYLNKNNISPRYPFGHGLSYTTFTRSATISSVGTLTSTPPARAAKGSTPVYSNAIPPASEVDWPTGFSAVSRYLYPYLNDPEAISATGTFAYPTGYSNTSHADPVAGGDLGGNPALWDTMFSISVTVTNTGLVAGKSVAMVFVQYPSDSAYDVPIIQLRAFDKTSTLAPGGKETLTLTITRKDLSVWDVVTQNWVVPVSGSKPFLFWVGDSSGGLTLACESLSLACSGGRTAPVV
ncbi:putative beta-glucosidase 1 [Coleophoma cylindrospora]|uniref:beta-glucosidase n=1 Tax=Coleophoma cylindrospora TaxID=1849047 RepID=A0A3D8RB64_9HELO|nr:putative beta-glucosidase 1 [Coleophoma cylindrospora]